MLMEKSKLTWQLRTGAGWNLFLSKILIAPISLNEVHLINNNCQKLFEISQEIVI